MSAFGVGCQWWSLICGESVAVPSILYRWYSGTGLCPRFSFWCHNIWVLGCLGVCAQMEAVRYQALAAGLGLRLGRVGTIFHLQSFRSKQASKEGSNHVGLCWFIMTYWFIDLTRTFPTVPYYSQIIDEEGTCWNFAFLSFCADLDIHGGSTRCLLWLNLVECEWI